MSNPHQAAVAASEVIMTITPNSTKRRRSRRLYRCDYYGGYKPAPLGIRLLAWLGLIKVGNRRRAKS